MNNPKLWAVVPAAGSGKRFSATALKQYQKILDKTVLEHTISALFNFPLQACMVAISAQDNTFDTLNFPPNVYSCLGGNERMDSVYAALLALEAKANDDDYVLVHDAARPCLNDEQVSTIINFCRSGKDAAILAVPVRDTLKKSTDNQTIEATLSRDLVWQAQTPQIVKYKILRDALFNAMTTKALVTDEASALERLGIEVTLLNGRMDNLKITYPEDLELASLILSQRS